MEYARHANKFYERELGELRNSLKKMADLITRMLNIAMRALENPSRDLSLEARALDHEINALNFGAEELVTEIITKREVYAEELRFILSSIKIATYFERMGDLVKSSVKRLAKIGQDLPQQYVPMIREIVDLNLEFLLALSSILSDADPVKTQRIWESDDRLDSAYIKTFKSIQAELEQNPGKVKPYTHLLITVRNLERVGDYTASIAKILYYIKSGTIVTKEMAKQLAVKDDIVA